MSAAEDAPDGPSPGAPGPDEPIPTRARLPTTGVPDRFAAAWPVAAAFALAVLVRLLPLGLPIEGDPVAHGALGRSLAHGDGFTIDGVANDRVPPGHPALLALALLFGGTVTGTSRVLGILLGGAVAALLVSIARYLVKGKPPLPLLIVLAAAHPALALFAGGLAPGSEATGLVLLLASLRLALSRSDRARRGAVVLAGLLPIVRFDLVAFPIAVAWLVHRHAAAGGAGADRWRERVRARAPAFATLFVPLLLWLVRNAVVTGRPLGTGDASLGPSLGRPVHNGLVLAALVLPAAGLGVLWIFVPAGLRRLWQGRASDRPAVRTAFLGVGLHLVLVALFAGSAFGGDGALAFSSESLRFGLAATPFVVLAAIAGLTAGPRDVKSPVAMAAGALSLLLSVWLLGGSLQRALPFHVQQAGRLHLLAEAYDAALAEATPYDWIGLDLAPRPNAGVEVFLGDRAPGQRTGVVAAADVPAGAFPSAPVLPLRDGLGGAVRCWLVSDLEYDGVIFTGERKDLRRGGQGIFQRIGWKPVPGGSAGSYTIHQVIRPAK